MAELADAHGSGYTPSVNLQIRLIMLQNADQAIAPPRLSPLYREKFRG